MGRRSYFNAIVGRNIKWLNQCGENLSADSFGGRGTETSERRRSTRHGQDQWLILNCNRHKGNYYFRCFNNCFDKEELEIY